MSYRLSGMAGRHIKKAGFCERKYRSLLATATLTIAVIFVMLLSDSVIAGHFFGETGVAAINTVMPVSGFVAFFSSIISCGTSILYSREIGAMRKRRANELFGQGLVLSAAIAVSGALLLVLFGDAYFRRRGITGDIYRLATGYYQWLPMDLILDIMISYLSQLVYSDGDELCNNIALGLRIVGNIVLSITLARSMGIAGIMLGTVIGNALGILAICMHFFRKSNTLRFIWHFSLADLRQIVRFGIVDAVIYICWAIADYVLIGHVSAHYGEVGHVTLATVMGLIEFSIVLDGAGLALQPMMETYMGEKNHTMIRRLMHISMNMAVFEGVIANAVVFVFARQFCLLLGIDDAEALLPSIHALRIVSMGLAFCSMVSLMTSYYVLVDHVALSVGITVLKDGLLYALLPVIASAAFGESGMWAAFAAAPMLALAVSLLYIRLRYGKARFPYLLEPTYRDIVVMDETLTTDSCTRLSERVQQDLLAHGRSQALASRASLFMEEIGLTILEKNGRNRRPILIEVSLLYDDALVRLIERDSGIIFDITDSDMKVEGLSGFLLSNLMERQHKKAYLTTTGYNRNILQFEEG